MSYDEAIEMLDGLLGRNAVSDSAYFQICDVFSELFPWVADSYELDNGVITAVVIGGIRYVKEVSDGR